MAAKDEITTKFKVDISDLKKGIEEANREIKLADATFKAATAGMDDWSKSADGIKSKLDQLGTVLNAQKSKLADYNEELKRQQDAYTKNGENITKLKDKLQQLADQGVSKTSDEYKKYENALAACEKEQANNEKSADKLKITILEQQAAVNKTEADINKYGSALDDLEKEQGRTDKATDELSDSFNDLSDSAKQSGDGFTVMKGALASLVADGINAAVDAIKNFVKESIDVGKNFDSSMSKVSAISGATGEELDALREKAKEMGASTKFSATEAADALNYMAMAGWETGDMLDGIEGIMNLAAASGEDLARTSDIVTDALTAFGMKAEESGHFADILAQTSSSANTNVSMLGESFKYVAPLMGSLGYSAEDASIALGLMANAGIKSSQAGTSLKSALANMANPTKNMQGVMNELGLSLTDVDGNMLSLREVLDQLREKFAVTTDEQVEYNYAAVQTREYMGHLMDGWDEMSEAEKKYNTEMAVGISQIEAMNEAQLKQAAADELGIKLTKERKITAEEYDELAQKLGQDTLNGLSQAEQAAAASTLFGKEAMAGMLNIINASEEDYNRLTESIDNCDGAALRMAETMQDNLEGDLTKLGSQFEGVQIALYEKLEPALRSGVAVLSDLVTALGFVVEHSEEFATAIEIVAAAVAAFLIAMNWGAIMSAAAAAIQGVAVAVRALGTVIAANPVGLLASAIAALIVVGIKLVEHLANEETAIKSVEQAEKDLADARQNTIDMQVSYADAVDRATTAQEKLAEAEEAAGITGEELYEQVRKGTLDYADMTDEQKKAYKAYLDNEEAQRKLKEATEALEEAKKAETIASYENDLALAKETGSYEDFKKAVVDAFEKGELSAEEARDLIGKSMSEMSRSAQQTFMKDIPSDITNGLDPKQYETKGQRIKKWFGSLGDDIKKLWSICWEGIKKIWSVVSEWFKEKVIEPLVKAWDETVEDIKNFFENAKKKIQDIWEGVAGWFNEKVIEPIHNFFSGLWEGLTNGASKVWESIQSVFNGVKDWFTEKFDAAWTAIKQVFEPVTSWFAGIWDGIKKVFEPVTSWFSNVFEKVGNIIKTPLNAVIRAINTVIDGLNSLSFDVPDWVPFIGGQKLGFNIPHLPLLARGGVLNRGQVGLLEGNGAEAVVPLEKNKYWIHEVAADMLRQMQTASGGSVTNIGGANDYNFTQIINAPKSPSRIEIYRQTRNLLSFAKAAGGV